MTISKILKIMEFAFLNPERYNEEYVKQRFGEADYELFSQFCLGGPPDMQLAHYIGKGALKLTQRGVREYHALQSQQTQQYFNRLMLIATITLALSSVALVIITGIK